MHATRVLTTAEVPDDLLVQAQRLLADAFEGRFADEDWEHALGGWHVVVTERELLVAHAAVVPRVLEVANQPFATGYVEAVATAPDRQRAGLGSLAMVEATAVVRREFEMGALSTGSREFYERLGWERWRGPTFVRRGAEQVRTEEEDDGVMVLRFGPSSSVDLAAALSCEARSGDDW